jgi:hypothetical protein
MAQQKNSMPFSAKVLIWLQFFLGFGAVVSGALMMLSPDGSLMKMPLSVIEGSPFKSFFFPGLVLFTLLGVYPLGVAYGLWKSPGWNWPDVINPIKNTHWSWAGSLASGVIVIIWLSAELIWASLSFLHVIYYVWSGAIILLSLLPATRLFYQRAKSNL